MAARFGVTVALILGTCLLYAPTLSHEFINFDTPKYLWLNPWVPKGLTLAGIQWAFTTFELGNWHPLTWISHMADVSVFGLEPAGHHAVSVLFHAVNAALLFWFLLRSTDRLWPAALVATLFAVHPAHVESVAWVAERKDVLSTFWLLLALLAYLAYVKSPGLARYALLFLLTAMGLLSKPAVVTLPFILLLLDYWPLNRFSRDRVGSLVIEKVPLLLLVLPFVLATLLAQGRYGAMEAGTGLELGARLGNAAVAYVHYLGSAFSATNLALFHPHPGTWPTLQIGASIALLTVVSLASLALVRRAPYLFVGWSLFLGTLVPMIGIVQVGAQSWADRYTYVSFIGLFIAVVYGLRALAERFRVRPSVPAGAGVLAVVLYSLVCWQYLSHWRNSLSIWSHTLLVTDVAYPAVLGLEPRNPTLPRLRGASKAYYKMGSALYNAGLYQEALVHANEARTLAPAFPYMHILAGNSLLAMQRPEEALAAFEEAARIDPGNHALQQQIADLRRSLVSPRAGADG